MTPQDFCYWLQGHFELNGPNITPEQAKIIQDHLQLVFNKQTPTYFDSTKIVPLSYYPLKDASGHYPPDYKVTFNNPPASC